MEPKTTVDPGRSSTLRQAVFEREEAVLDLADAAQAATRAAMMADRGERVESDFFDHLAHGLYKRADGRRRLADQLRKVAAHTATVTPGRPTTRTRATGGAAADPRTVRQPTKTFFEGRPVV